jgi:MinD superfamily P-loop ATPase
LLVDCDVEEPNTPLFFPESPEIASEEVFLKVPQIDLEKCTFCRNCVGWCEFNAITVIPPVSFAKIDEGLCHSCGACLYACSDGAIFEISSKIGDISSLATQGASEVRVGHLKIGSAMQTSMIRQLKKKTTDQFPIVIYDSPPGTSCPVVETMSGADSVILVTEPTPFGLHDLKLTVDLVRDMKIPFGVVINKAGLGSGEIYDYLKAENIDLLGEIPFSKEYASLYAQGLIIKEIPAEMAAIYQRLGETILNKRIP